MVELRQVRNQQYIVSFHSMLYSSIYTYMSDNAIDLHQDMDELGHLSLIFVYPLFLAMTNTENDDDEEDIEGCKRLMRSLLVRSNDEFH